ncbi:hypothetical protein [Haloferula sp.]|uniref:hypothetical protein n=1 Tax=Haloferula sp. TaxID=2497595 RepID=UPI003C781F99
MIAELDLIVKLSTKKSATQLDAGMLIHIIGDLHFRRTSLPPTQQLKLVPFVIEPMPIDHPYFPSSCAKS